MSKLMSLQAYNINYDQFKVKWGKIDFISELNLGRRRAASFL